MEIRLKNKPFLLAGITAALGAAELEAGTKYAFDIFDPATMGQTPVVVEVAGREDVTIAGSRKSATRMVLKFKGSSQTAWIDDSGDVRRTPVRFIVKDGVVVNYKSYLEIEKQKIREKIRRLLQGQQQGG